jgi:hypothetical protein
MSNADLWPWFAIAGLGLFHGLNPAMGWLFAVALGLQRGERRTVFISLAPIALGHALAVALTLAGVLALGLMLDTTMLTRVAGAGLLGWALWHAWRGHRQGYRIGMQAGLAGIALWSFVVSATHGAGLMLLPVVLPICSAAGATPQGSALAVTGAVATHTGAMLLASGLIAICVYQWLGVGFLRRAWINLDWIWVTALALCGALLLVSA